MCLIAGLLVRTSLKEMWPHEHRFNYQRDSLTYTQRKALSRTQYSMGVYTLTHSLPLIFKAIRRYHDDSSSRIRVVYCSKSNAMKRNKYFSPYHLRRVLPLKYAPFYWWKLNIRMIYLSYSDFGFAFSFSFSLIYDNIYFLFYQHIYTIIYMYIWLYV